jgi:hypothetical protein
MQEVLWRSLRDAPKYKVANNGYVMGPSGKMLKPWMLNKYPHISLVNDKGKQVNKSIHRLVAIYFIPNKGNLREVDHKDGDRSNNHWLNLRWATRQQNRFNSRANKTKKTSRYKGVAWQVARKKWIVSLCINGKRLTIGRFNDEREAAIAYNKAAIKHYGQFAYINLL